MGEWALRKPFVLACYGTSLTTGRLSTFWPERLREEINAFPECVGPVIIQNMGKGSQNSDWGVANMGFIVDLNPTHILTESFAINDSAVTGGVPAVSRANHLANMQTMHNAWKARNPNVDITWQTMNGVSADGMALRPNLPDYYADEVTKAAAMGDRLLNNYAGAQSPPGIAGGWPKPLPPELTQSGDGLHPTKIGTDTYLWPNVAFWARLRMAEFWGLPAPNPPEPPPLPDANYLVVAGGGQGQFGGGGAAGRRRGATLLGTLFGPVFVGEGVLSGEMAFIGPNTADGGGLGGNSAGFAPGYPGASGGGGGFTNSGTTPGGAGDPTQGNDGGLGSLAGAGGGGVLGVGNNGTPVETRQGGAGEPIGVPGETGSICAGGPGGQNGSDAILPYLPGGGPSNPGGGGRGADYVNPADPGGDGVAWVYYPGAQRATGGAISAYGGFTKHKFTRADMVRPVAMTSNNSPAGLVASEGNGYGGGYLPYLAFRNNPPGARGWVGIYPAWLQQATAAPRRVTAYSISGFNGTTSPEWRRTPSSWELRASNDDFATYDVVDTRAGEVFTLQNMRRAFRVTNPGSYLAYRLFITATQNSADNLTEVGTLSLWECPELQPL